VPARRPHGATAYKDPGLSIGRVSAQDEQALVDVKPFLSDSGVPVSR